MTQRFDKLVTLLKELFQLDQPDLDFGFYRVMHAKSAEVTQFLDKDLLPQVAVRLVCHVAPSLKKVTDLFFSPYVSRAAKQTSGK
jgi:hypothetical protein